MTTIQSHMLKVFGLKFRTTSEMVRELALAGALKVDEHGLYHLTEKQQIALKRVAAQEDKERLVSPLLRCINALEDMKTREKAMRLYEKLLDILPDASDAEG